MLLVERHKDSIFFVLKYFTLQFNRTVTTIQPMHPHCKHQVTDHIQNINPNRRKLLRYFFSKQLRYKDEV
ncbi:hypothetical protein BACEGG_02817 [Bacteroides eggerthii DSM 20697]|nr:hypothetical protein BACEGG_02817 [Bacteroides eggerthii DSM 20697]